MSDYKISFVSVSLGRRISFAEYVGVKCDFMPVEMFIAACAIISKHPEDCVISSKVVFKAHRI